MDFATTDLDGKHLKHGFCQVVLISMKVIYKA